MPSVRSAVRTLNGMSGATTGRVRTLPGSSARHEPARRWRPTAARRTSMQQRARRRLLRNDESRRGPASGSRRRAPPAWSRNRLHARRSNRAIQRVAPRLRRSPGRAAPVRPRVPDSGGKHLGDESADRRRDDDEGRFEGRGVLEPPQIVGERTNRRDIRTTVAPADTHSIVAADARVRCQLRADNAGAHGIAEAAGFDDDRRPPAARAEQMKAPSADIDERARRRIPSRVARGGAPFVQEPRQRQCDEQAEQNHASRPASREHEWRDAHVRPLPEVPVWSGDLSAGTKQRQNRLAKHVFMEWLVQHRRGADVDRPDVYVGAVGPRDEDHRCCGHMRIAPHASTSSNPSVRGRMTSMIARSG